MADILPKTEHHPLLRHPRTKEPLIVTRGFLVGALSGDEFPIREAALPTYDLFIDDCPSEEGRDPEQVWDREAFESGFAKVGFYENGIEFDEILGRDRRLAEFHFRRVKKRLLDWLRPGPGHRVLDVGCGAGYFLGMIRDVYAEAGFEPHLVGCEASAVQLQYMTRVMRKRGLLDATPVLANAEYLPFADASFDVVTCSEVLEHIRTPQRALDEMRRILRPGGRLLLSTPSMLNEQIWDLLLFPMVSIGKAVLPKREYDTTRGNGAGYDVPWYPSELQRAVTAASLEIERFEPTGLIPHPHYFDYVPRPLMPGVMAAFEQADRLLANKLPALNAHLLVMATRRD